MTTNPPPPDAAPGTFRRIAIPRRNGGSTDPPPKKTKTTISTATQRVTLPRIKARLTEWFNLAAAGITLRDPFDGFIIGANAEKLADAYAPLIERDKRLQQFFAQLEKGGAYGAAITVTVGVAIPILIHHGKLPDSLLPVARLTGVTIPDHIPVTEQPIHTMAPDATSEPILA